MVIPLILVCSDFWAYYAFEIASCAFEQCSKVSLIMLKLCPFVSHYAPNMLTSHLMYLWMFDQFTDICDAFVNVLLEFSTCATGADPEFGCTLLKTKKTNEGRSRVGEGSSNITMKLKYIIIIPTYSFTHCQHCDCFIRVTDWLLY